MANKVNVEYLIKNVRFSYLYCFEPYRDRESGKESFSSHGIITPDHVQFPEIVGILKKIAQDFWGDSWQEVWAEMKVKNKICLKPGAAKGNIEGYKDNYFISANKKTRFSVVETRNGVNVQLTAADGRPRSGDYGNMKVAFYPMKHPKGGNMINADLQGIQYVRKGAPLGGGGRVAAVEEFGIEPSDADSAAPAAAGSGAVASVDDLLG